MPPSAPEQIWAEMSDSPNAHPRERWSPADTMLGMPQRGRGLGWLRAESDPAAGRAALLQCLGSDPCWDAQVEERSLYYGTSATGLA